MKLYPYCLPLVPQYKTKSFQKATRTWKKPIEALIQDRHRRFRARRSSYWIYLDSRRRGQKRNSKGRSAWQLKLYICVQAPYYWPCIERLIKRSKPVNCRWKFCMGEGGYQRPDKIMFYYRSIKELTFSIRSLRRCLKGCRFHELRHAAPIAEFGLGKAGEKGIYAGCDPSFLHKDCSWRMYRALCSAWASLNKDYLKGLPEGIAGWHERMNLSRRHEGPASLTPDARHFPYIRRYWKLVNTTA
jgi:hypothetical protein